MPDRLQPQGTDVEPDRDVDRLLDEALAATFPASDPVAISVRGAESGAYTDPHDPARPVPLPTAAGHH